MLAQVVSQTAYLRSPSGTIQVRRGTLLFVAKKDKLCTVTYEDHVYKVHSSHLMFISSEKEMLSPLGIEKLLEKREQERIASIQDQFDKL